MKDRQAGEEDDGLVATIRNVYIPTPDPTQAPAHPADRAMPQSTGPTTPTSKRETGRRSPPDGKLVDYINTLEISTPGTRNSKEAVVISHGYAAALGYISTFPPHRNQLRTIQVLLLQLGTLVHLRPLHPPPHIFYRLARHGSLLSSLSFSPLIPFEHTHCNSSSQGRALLPLCSRSMAPLRGHRTDGFGRTQFGWVFDGCVCGPVPRESERVGVDQSGGSTEGARL